jgi:hypothetical protein
MQLSPIPVYVIFQESWLGYLVHWDWIVIGTVALALLTGWLAWETRALRIDAAKSAKASEKAIIMANRPKIIIQNIFFSSDPLGFSGGAKVSGSFQIYNSGNTSAEIYAVVVKVWLDNLLPMKFPYDTSGGEKRDSRLFELPPGKYAEKQFDELVSGNDTLSTSIPKADPKIRIYLMGVISYGDALGNLRTTRFCREFDRESCRFHPVRDAEYENAA